jgi:predicted nicotinamide N-methyase
VTRLISRFALRSALWLTLFALAATPAARNDYALTAAIVAAYFLPPALAYLLPARGLRARVAALPEALYPLLLAATATAIWLLAASGGYAGQAATAALVASALTLGLFAVCADLAHRAALARGVAPDALGPAAAAQSLLDRSVIAIVPIPAAILSLIDPAAAALVAAALLAVATMSLWVTGRDRGGAVAATEAGARPGNRRALLIFHAVAFGSGAIAGALLSLLLAAPGAALLTLVGVGLLIGSPPMPRVLLRVSAPSVVLATSAAAAILAAGVLLMGQPWYAQPGWVLIVAFPLLGIAGMTQDAVRRIAVRRLAPDGDYPAAETAGRAALGSGQLVGALAVVIGASSGVGVSAAVILVAVGQLVLVALALVVGGVRANLRVGGLSMLPVKSVVHQLSWATNPAAQAADFAGAGLRERRLARWIGREVELELLSVTLPVSKRHYSVARPVDASRERLFEAGRADPDRQMPYWAKVWPSGVALADVVVERSGKVKGARLLELGAGLGVTACAVLEAGGQLMTADYSALPLAICRLNTLANTGRAPRATCFNWRYPPEVARAVAQPDFRGGFPLILAADVLYEGRDAIPLLHVIERLLTASGELWLAEPVRRTAQRFLDAAAEQGWDIESRQVRAEWPDATNGPVNLHFLKRSTKPDAVAGDLGGWRV